MTRINATGDIDSARRAFTDFPQGIRLGPLIFQGDVAAIVGMRVYLDVLERRFSDAFLAFEKEMEASDFGILAVDRARNPSRVARRCRGSQVCRGGGSPCSKPDLKNGPMRPSMTELSWVCLALGRNRRCSAPRPPGSRFNVRRKGCAFRDIFSDWSRADRGACGCG